MTWCHVGGTWQSCLYALVVGVPPATSTGMPGVGCVHGRGVTLPSARSRRCGAGLLSTDLRGDCLARMVGAWPPEMCLPHPGTCERPA